jgi:hypothetical protein
MESPNLTNLSGQNSGASGDQQSHAGQGEQSGASHENRATARPEALPEQYWDAGTNQPKFDDLYKDFGELSQFKNDHDAALGKVPEKPEGYTPPEKLISDELQKQLPEGMQIKVDEKSPMLTGMQQWAHENKLSPEAFQTGFQRFVELQVKEKLASENNHREFIASEDKKLGANAPARKQAVTDFLKATLGEGALKAFVIDGDNRNTTAAQLEALEQLQQKFTAGGKIVPLHQHRDNEQAAPAKAPLEERMFPNRNLNSKAG